MSYTGLVRWYAGALGTAEGQTTRRVYRTTARPQTPSAALEQPGDRGTAPSYGGLVGWYAAVLTAPAPQETIRATTPAARAPLPYAA